MKNLTSKLYKGLKAIMNDLLSLKKVSSSNQILTIELLSPDIIEANKKLADDILQRSSKMMIGLGWHYLLDLIWILKQICEHPKGSVILDAGAGNGLLQFLLADLGYKIVSADFAPRILSEQIKLHYRVIEVATEKTYSNDYIQHLQSEFKSALSKNEIILSNPSEFKALLKNNPPGTIFYYRTDICSMNLIQDEIIDCAVSLSALEHNDHEAFYAAINEICRVVKTDGKIVATVSATDKESDWFHTQSKGWCYTEKSLMKMFNLSEPLSNFAQWNDIFGKLKHNRFLQEHLAPSYFASGNNGMPWGVWEPQYQPVGILKFNRKQHERIEQKNGDQTDRQTPTSQRVETQPDIEKGKLSALIDTTDGCNLRCTFCSRKTSKIKIMSTESFRLLIGKIRPFFNTIQLCCAWEYSIAPNAHEIVDILGEHKFKTVSIYTNGQLLPDKLADSIIEAKIDNLVFSIGESKKETYERIRIGGKFEKVIGNIMKMRDSKVVRGAGLPTLCTNLTLINSNIGELPEFVDLAYYIGISEIRGRHLILNEGLEMDNEVIQDQDHANKIIETAEQKAFQYGIKFNIPRYSNVTLRKDCKAPWAQFYISSNGDVSVCPRIHKYVKCGNIINDNIQQILDNADLKDFQSQMKKGSFKNKVCGICLQNQESRQYINQGF